MMLATFATLINQKVLVPSSRSQYVAVDRNHLVDFLKPILRQIYVDKAWYLRTNPDIAEAIGRGVVDCPQDHYVASGYYEHRMPYEIIVDEEWYLSNYEDVRSAVTKQLFGSGHDHFYAVGFKEGRLPHADFSLQTTT